MAKITLEEAQESEFLTLPQDALVKVRVLDHEIIDLDGRYGPWQKLNFKFEVLEVLYPEGYEACVGQWVWGGVPFRFTDHPDNALKQWVEAIYGLELQPGFELDTDQLNGRECKAVIETYMKNNGYEGNRVGSLVPLGGAVSTPQAADSASSPSEPQTLQSVASSPAGGVDDDLPF